MLGLGQLVGDDLRQRTTLSPPVARVGQCTHLLENS